jgi:hypothetical protein
MGIVSQPRYVWPIQPTLGHRLVDIANPLYQGLTAYWIFNEGGGNPYNLLTGNQGTLNGNTAWVNDRNGYVLSFDGTNSYVQADLASYPTTNHRFFSVAYWVYLNNLTPSSQGLGAGSIGACYNCVIDANEDGSGAGMALAFNASGAINYFGGGNDVVGNNSIGLKKWAFITVTIQDSGSTPVFLKTYINGALDLSATSNYTPGSATFVRFGHQSWNGGWLNGRIGWVGFWGRTLSANEISSIYADTYQVIEPPTSRSFMMIGSGGGNTVVASAMLEGVGETTNSGVITTNSSVLLEGVGELNLTTPPSFGSLLLLYPKHYWSIQPPLGAAELDLSQSLVSCMLFNEQTGGLAYDLAQSGQNPATVNSLVTWKKDNAPLPGSVISIDGGSGVNSGVIQNNLINAPMANGPLSLLIWFNTPTNPPSLPSTLIGLFDSSYNGLKINWRVSFGVEQGSSASSILRTPSLPTVNTWHCVIYSQTSATTGTIYMDGLPVVSGALGISANAVRIIRMWIGKNAYAGGSEPGPAGCMIGATMLFNRAITDQEAYSLYIDPYQVILPPSSRRYVIFSSGGNNILASAILQSIGELNTAAGVSINASTLLETVSSIYPSANIIRVSSALLASVSNLDSKATTRYIGKALLEAVSSISHSSLDIQLPTKFIAEFTIYLKRLLNKSFR